MRDCDVIKSPEQVAGIGQACQIVSATLAHLRPHILPGVTTLELDRLAEEFILGRGGVPAFKGYRNFPNSICASVNSEIVHGIPNHRRLKLGDIVSVDVGVRYGGYYGDSAFTFVVGGKVPPAVSRLLSVTREALARGVAAARPGNTTGDIGNAIDSYVSDAGFSVVRELSGHGVGVELHEDFQVPNLGRPGEGDVLRAGMVIAIEPMVNLGSAAIKTAGDGWTIYTADRKLSAHFEHTVHVTDDGPVVLTSFPL
jgi:methionyl aminopeptidase